MSRNKIVIYITIIAIVVLITIPTIITIIDNYNTKLYNTTISKIKTAAKECVNKELCINEKITLKELYDHDLLTKVVNPLTKEFFSETSYITINGNDFDFKSD